MFYNSEVHDSTPLTASDVKFSLERARSKDSTNAQKALFSDINEIIVINDLTLKISLKNPNGNFISNLAWGDAVIVSERSIAKAETAPVGTGPFKFSKWIKGDRVELIKNENYPTLAEATLAVKILVAAYHSHRKGGISVRIAEIPDDHPEVFPWA